MKLGSILATATVVGAVAIGGATTGTTLALWRDAAAVPSGTVTSGDIALTVNGSATATLPPLGSMQPGVSHTVPLSFTNTGTGANLRLVASISSVSSTNAAGVPLTYRFRRLAAGEPCSATGSFTTFAGAAIALTDPLAPGASAHACMTVTLDRSSLPSSQQSSTVTFTFTGAQVRP